ncbi:MAG: hypothetical protein ACYC6S_10600 [Desulfobulbia bacterium]
MLSLPRHLKASLLESGHNTCTICHLTDLNALNEVVSDELPGIFLCVQSCLKCGGIKKFSVARLEQSGTGWIIGSRPAFTEVEIIP